MTSEDLRSELERDPFTQIRLHLVSGASFEIHRASDATLLQNAVMLLQGHDPRYAEAGYDMISLRNIERVEQIRSAIRHSDDPAK